MSESKSPEGILLQMRNVGAAVYSARWWNDDNELIASCVIVDDSVDAQRLLDFAATLESAEGPTE